MALPTSTIATGGYEEYYGLETSPFALTPDDRFFVESEGFSSTLDELLRSIRRREPLLVVTGEIGVGKTTLCRSLASRLPPQTRVVVLANPSATVDGLLEQLMNDWDVDPRSVSIGGDRRAQALAALKEFLTRLAPERKHAIILIDEAQDLGTDALEGIRLVFDLNARDSTLLQIVMFGRRGLDMILDRLDMREFSRRIVKRLELRPLSGTEIAQYIERRLWVAHGGPSFCLADQPGGGYEPWRPGAAHFWRVRLTPAAVRVVSELSNGVPLLVNLFCDRALQVGHERRKHLIEADMVLTAARRLQVPVPWRLNLVRATKHLKVAGVVVGLTAAAAWGLSELSAGSAGESPLAAGADVPDAALGMLEVIGPLEETQGFLVAVASFPSSGQADTVTRYVVQLGLPGFVRRAPDGWQAVVGPYATREEAAGAQRRLTAAELTGSTIVTSGTP